MRVFGNSRGELRTLLHQYTATLQSRGRCPTLERVTPSRTIAEDWQGSGSRIVSANVQAVRGVPHFLPWRGIPSSLVDWVIGIAVQATIENPLFIVIIVVLDTPPCLLAFFGNPFCLLVFRRLPNGS
jgi:hypothetical protein